MLVQNQLLESCTPNRAPRCGADRLFECALAITGSVPYSSLSLRVVVKAILLFVLVCSWATPQQDQPQQDQPPQRVGKLGPIANLIPEKAELKLEKMKDSVIGVFNIAVKDDISISDIEFVLGEACLVSSILGEPNFLPDHERIFSNDYEEYYAGIHQDKDDSPFMIAEMRFFDQLALTEKVTENIQMMIYDLIDSVASTALPDNIMISSWLRDTVARGYADRLDVFNYLTCGAAGYTRRKDDGVLPLDLETGSEIPENNRRLFVTSVSFSLNQLLVAGIDVVFRDVDSLSIDDSLLVQFEDLEEAVQSVSVGIGTSLFGFFRDFAEVGKMICAAADLKDGSMAHRTCGSLL